MHTHSTAQPPSQPAFLPADLVEALKYVREPMHVVRDSAGRLGVNFGGQTQSMSTVTTLPPMFPEWLGDRAFCEQTGLRFPYVVGEMANGIATIEMVIAAGEAGMLGFFGAAGLSYDRVEAAVTTLSQRAGDRFPWGVNLIHSPNEPSLEERVAALLIDRKVPLISASAFMGLTPAVVRVAYAGIHTDARGQVVRPRTLFAKISRPEVARRFLSPAPSDLLQQLVTRGWLTAAEAELAKHLPVAEALTIEADSGGHTDNQTLTAQFPSIISVRDELAEKFGYTRPIHCGAAGGLGTPSAIAAAFSLGAAFVTTGSVNQAAVEAGLSEAGKVLLAKADLADVTMAPASDMFELGVDVQVLRRGTMFAARAKRLYEAYKAYDAIEDLPPKLKARIEKDTLRASCEEIWAECERFWAVRDADELARGQRDPKHRMALIFRWYLGKASRWAIEGDPSRVADYQIWCGPAMGAFNRWTQGSFLADPKERTVAQIGRNLLEGAAVITRAQQLRAMGVAVPAAAFDSRPRPLR
ncbi:MAG: PfaD family polyunsaturated fatty acid/polyketide biosynthesis protein [Myxococcales bacterium]|nr:PfaD family polyunsaturated fatty acid/polyketide biosynthesis protein [Myxococcales bacterium]